MNERFAVRAPGAQILIAQFVAGGTSGIDELVPDFPQCGMSVQIAQTVRQRGVQIPAGLLQGIEQLNEGKLIGRELTRRSGYWSRPFHN